MTTAALVHQPNLPPAPTLPTWNPLGHMLGFRSDPLGLFERARDVGDVVRLRVGWMSIYAAYAPEHAQHVLVDRSANYTKQSRGYQRLRSFLGDGLLTAEGELWRTQRRIAQPAFRHDKLAGFASGMVQAAEDMVAGWQADTVVDVAEAMNRLTLRIAGETLLGLDLTGEAEEVGQALSDVLGGFIKGVTLPIVDYLPLPSTIRYRRGLATLDRVVREIIARRRADGSSHDDLLGMFMDARDAQTGLGMSDDQLRDEVLTMLLAGHETTANALAFTLMCLAQHPEVAAKVAAEARAVQGPLGVGSLGQLGYIDQVLRESMRLYPPVWVESRRATEADVIGGVPIPAGGYVFLSQFAIQRHPRYWSSPLEFRPERWAEPALCPDGSPRPRHAWFPFGLGGRKCIGEHFAMMEAKLVLAVMARSFGFALLPGQVVELEPSVTLRPRGGLGLRVLAV